jgi:hypothetical protein
LNGVHFSYIADGDIKTQRSFARHDVKDIPVCFATES